MIRSFFLLLITLLFIGTLSAQTDTTSPPPAAPVQTVQDSPVNHKDTGHRIITVKHRADSTHRRDSSLHRTDTAKMSRTDSSPTAMAGIKKDSPATPAKPAAPVYKGPEAAVYWMKVLRSGQYLDFLGPTRVLQEQYHRSISRDLLFYLIVGILFYFALIRMFFEKYFGNLITLFFRVSLRQQQIREQVLQAPLPSLLLNILFIISGGLYACFLVHYSRLGANIHHFWTLYADCMAGLIVIYLLKFVVLKFCGWVFNISRATDTYIFVVFLVNKMLGIFLLPFLIVITFSGPEVREIVITISFVMIFVLMLYRVFAAYRPVRNEIKLNLFYFFLYLCAFEIAPLLLIYKMLLNYLEKVY